MVQACLCGSEYECLFVLVEKFIIASGPSFCTGSLRVASRSFAAEKVKFLRFTAVTCKEELLQFVTPEVGEELPWKGFVLPGAASLLG